MTFPLGNKATRIRSSEEGSQQAAGRFAEDPRIKRSASAVSSTEDFTFEDTFASSAEASIAMDGVGEGHGLFRADSTGGTRSRREPTLINGLIPLNFFLRTDIVQLVPGDSTRQRVQSEERKDGREESSSAEEGNDASAASGGSSKENSEMPERWSIVIGGRTVEPMPHAPKLLADYAFRENIPVEKILKGFPAFPSDAEETKSTQDDVSQEVIAEAVRQGDFSVSLLTPLNSLLRVWAVAGGDHPEDHLEVRTPSIHLCVCVVERWK